MQHRSVDHLLSTNMENEIPSLYDVSQLSRDFGLVGERDTHLVVLLSFLDGGFVCMTGLSRGGKDHVVDAADYCMPDDIVFKVPDSTSKTVLFEKKEQMNNARVHRYPDITTLQDKSHLEDIMKRHGDGNVITHERTINGGGETESMTLLPPSSFVLFVASDNEQVDLNDFPELRNRALVISIDASQELTEKVNTRQAKQRAGLIDYNFTDEEQEDIRDYLGTIPMDIFGEGGSGATHNPVAPALDNQNPLPQHFTEARQDFPRLLDFMRSVALFHFENRMTSVIGGTATMFVTPKDCWLAMRIFGEQMVLSALNLRDKDFEMLDVLRELKRNGESGISKAELQQEMRDEGWNITNKDVHSALKNMETKGYVRKDQSGSPVIWEASEFAQAAKRTVQLDWQEVVDDTKESVYNQIDDDLADEYIERFCEGDGLFATHPFEGHQVDITDQNILEETVNEREEEEAEVFSEDLYTSDDDDGGSKSGALGD